MIIVPQIESNYGSFVKYSEAFLKRSEVFRSSAKVFGRLRKSSFIFGAL